MGGGRAEVEPLWGLVQTSREEQAGLFELYHPSHNSKKLLILIVAALNLFFQSTAHAAEVARTGGE